MKLEVEVFLAATHVKNRRFSDLKQYYGRLRTSSLRSDEISMLLSFTSKTTNESRRQWQKVLANERCLWDMYWGSCCFTNCYVIRNTAAELSTDEIITKLGWEPLTKRREAHVVSLVRKCIKNDVPSYHQNYLKLLNFHIHNYINTRIKTNLFLEKVNLKCTQQTFFYKGARIFNNLNKSWIMMYILNTCIYLFWLVNSIIVSLFIIVFNSRTCIESSFF